MSRVPRKIRHWLISAALLVGGASAQPPSMDPLPDERTPEAKARDLLIGIPQPLPVPLDRLGMALDAAEEAAQTGSAEEQFNLARGYETGLGVAADPVRARIWYRRAAHAGHAGAQRALAFHLLRDGQGNVEEAYRLLRAAARQGDVFALMALAAAHWHGLHGQPVSRERAFGLVRRAALAGSAEAQFQLAQMYAAGAGIEEDDGLALSWYRTAEAQGHSEAALRLAGRKP